MAYLELPEALSEKLSCPKISTYNCETVREIFNRFTKEHASLKHLFLDQQGQLNSYLSIYIDQKNIQQLSGLDTKVYDETNILVVTALAGG